MRALLREAEERCAAIIGENRAGLDKLIAALEERETLDAGEIETCLGRARPQVAPRRMAAAGSA